jgi:FHS family L-fucose permease-like MFS transporter
MAPLPDPQSVTPEVLDALRKTEAHAVQIPFIGIAVTLLTMAVVFWWLRHWRGAPQSEAVDSGHTAFEFLAAHPRLAFGVLSIFVYVGAEVSIGSVLTNYLMQRDTLGLAPVDAGKLVSFYWGGAMIGRFVGSGVLRMVSPGKVLAACALGAAALASTSALSSGIVAAVTVIAIGLCNSIMFPTIFSLAIEGLGPNTSRGSGLLCLAIVGGAIIPVMTGAAADTLGLGLALFVPAACYLVIAAYGWYARRPAAG